MGRDHRGRLPVLRLLLVLPLLCGAAGLGRGCAPRLLRFSGQVPENSPAGTRVRGLRMPLRRLLGPGEPAGEWALEGGGACRFFLQRRAGGGRGLLLLRTAERLDREAQPAYGLRLRRRAGRCQRQALLRVRILDRNDHRPRLHPARPREVEELAPLGTEVARLRASDGDEGSNARLTYGPWPPGAGSRLLFVVPRSGQVLTVGSLLGLRRLRLCVAAHDHGRPRPLRSPARCLRLAVRGRRPEGGGKRRWGRSVPLPERPPGPGSRRYTARLAPGARVGDAVFTVPRSLDRAAGGWFELASPGATPVAVDRASGRLYLRRELRAGGRAEVLVKVHRGGGRGRGTGMGPHLPWVKTGGEGGGDAERAWPCRLSPGRCGSGGMWGAAGAAPSLAWAVWGCAGSSPVPPAAIPPPDFRGAGENVGNGALVMLSSKNSCRSRFVGPGEFAHELRSS
ncbi:protocadherin-16-like [Neopsephotus bourkii]|uniref:protocadherin-16-like n=1 Tax=Neopsephotus bourkii TaxID=309878 RepID=UPI002AA569A6|nr:protocadherin-16-like [Neopsephotus bourkii]